MTADLQADPEPQSQLASQPRSELATATSYIENRTSDITCLFG